MNLKSICFTGHRNINPTAELKQRLEDTLKTLIKQGSTDFYAGGALGWDTLCAQTVLELRRHFPQIRLHLILPCPEQEQTAKWNDAQKRVYNEILAAADSAERTSEHYRDGCMKIRNTRLVELSDCCICYYNARKSISGTGQTVRMAQRKGIAVINLIEQ